MVSSRVWSRLSKKESPSGNSKYGVTDGAGRSDEAGITVGPEGLSEVDNPSDDAEPMPNLNTNVAHDEENVKWDGGIAHYGEGEDYS